MISAQLHALIMLHFATQTLFTLAVFEEGSYEIKVVHIIIINECRAVQKSFPFLFSQFIGSKHLLFLTDQIIKPVNGSPVHVPSMADVKYFSYSFFFVKYSGNDMHY